MIFARTSLNVVKRRFFGFKYKGPVLYQRNRMTEALALFRTYLKHCDVDTNMKFAVFQSCDFYEMNLILEEKWKFILKKYR